MLATTNFAIILSQISGKVAKTNIDAAAPAGGAAGRDERASATQCCVKANENKGADLAQVSHHPPPEPQALFSAKPLRILPVQNAAAAAAAGLFHIQWPTGVKPRETQYLFLEETVEHEDEHPLQRIEDGEEVRHDDGGVIEEEEAKSPRQAQQAEEGERSQNPRPAGSKSTARA